MRRFPLLALALIFLSVTACTDIPGLPGGGICTLELRIHLTPPDTSIRVGEDFRAAVALSSCGGAQQVRDVITWRSDDPPIATVDAATGRVVARGAGKTRIAATGKKYGALGAIAVSVAP